MGQGNPKSPAKWNPAGWQSAWLQQRRPGSGNPDQQRCP